jgi:hypothetical protein
MYSVPSRWGAGEGGEDGPYPPSPRLLEGILVPLVWVHLYVYLDNARYTEELSILYRSSEE